MINILDGKKLSEELIEKYKNEIKNLSSKYRKPKLVVITIGEDEASRIYLKKKEAACIKCNIDFINIKYDSNITKKEVKEKIKELNKDESVDGIFVQFPVPEELNGIEQEIDKEKDVDGLSIYNLGNSLYGNSQLESCTALGIIKMFEKNNIILEGKHVVILGRSNIVGKPLIGMLLNKNATVTSCNSYTKDIKQLTKTADILITSIGIPGNIDSSYIGDKTDVIIDAGISRNEEDKVCGDINYNSIMDLWGNISKDKYITPVPGGVGPMTVASLINNVLMCYKNKIKYIEN